MLSAVWFDKRKREWKLRGMNIIMTEKRKLNTSTMEVNIDKAKVNVDNRGFYMVK